MRRNLFASFPVLAILLVLVVGFPAYAACTAGSPNLNVMESTPTIDFSVNGDSTVTHTKTGLMWKQCAEGLSGPACSTGTASAITWANALKAANTANTAAFAGYTDWRLPNIKELTSIVEFCGYGPSINRTVFPASPTGFWSSTTGNGVGAGGGAWVANFFGNGGSIPNQSKTSGLTVRLVRGGPSIDSFSFLTPTLTINNVSQNEGNSGSSNFTFAVTLSEPAGPGGVTFDIATADGSATASSDYAAKSLTSQTIAAGSSTYAFDVVVYGDVTFEPDETFYVNVTNIVNAIGSVTQGLGTILNDDAATYSVTYNGNTSTSGTVPADGTAYVSGATVTVLGNTGSLVKTGSTFAGWNTAANGSGTPYAAAATFAIGAGNVTLYAQWTSSATVAGIPTMSEWGLIFLAGLMALFGMRQAALVRRS